MRVPTVAGPPSVIAHRGASRVAPENTLAAFSAARALGADGVELDIHRSVDGVLVVHHDAAAPGLGVLAEHSVAEIRAALPSAPTLDEALDACEGMFVNIEVKNLPGDPDHDREERAAMGVVELLHARAARDQVDDVLVSSFSLQTIDRVHELDSALPTGFLILVGFDPHAAADLARDRGHGALHPDVRTLGGSAAGAVVAHAHDIRLHVNVWTVDAPEEIRRLAAVGVDGIITNVPDVACRALDLSP
jgi:glycerophosphoryl diester phosphodiesterase